MKMEPVKVKIKPNAIKPKVAHTAREPPVHWRLEAKALIQDLLKQGIIKKVDEPTD